MTQTGEQFQTLMAEALAGSEAAARQLFELYEPVLLYAIRRKLNKKARSQFDSTDFTQDVWASFFAAPSAERVFANPQELLAFLTTLARNKVVDAMRQRLMLQKRNVHREQSLDDSRVTQKDDLIAQQPTPSQVVMTQEEWSKFLRTQPLVYRRVFILLRDGCTHEQIARDMGISVRTVDRIIARIATGAK